MILAAAIFANKNKKITKNITKNIKFARNNNKWTRQTERYLGYIYFN